MKVEDILENYKDLRKSTNLNNGNKELWMNQNLVRLNTHYFKDYILEFGIEYDAIDMNKPKNNYIKITKNDVIPVKIYIYPLTNNEEYKFIEDTNYFIRTVGRDDYLGEFINNEIKLTKINPNGFIRPETILNYSKLTQTKDKMYFVYENNKNQFVISEVTK